ncbi:dynein light intermediate chain-domain-containing protein [Hygrophoropsis aurantiaca]|uniref:Dynein light intermediate chain-domain-containing protein n=1 Tax=Hygrophoropsis aurantiaca TaxID=72124 RepID=A0ACB7ZX52_9AGAM|nr:dynein light intermediate chain-domain-containing protein [Hygrophoropsis aurantiaca]
MENSRPSTPEAPPADLWSSILDSVSSTRSIPSKQILLLGQPRSGKSVIASALLQKPASAPEEDKGDFALGYDWADVRDDADEDTLARLSVYTVPSTAAAYTALLPHFVPPRTALPHTAVIIVLDWTRPWTFVDELGTWLQWVEAWARGSGGEREVEIAREENRERLQAHLQHYTEDPASVPAASNLASNPDTLLPLGPGTLTHNTAGVPIIVVCAKADLIDEGADSGGLAAGSSGMGGMVKGKGGEWEERTDGVMQVLRTVCLKYGASLFYTTQQPGTLQVLRQHALHLLFMPPAPSSLLSSSAGTDAPAPARNPFTFAHRPNTLDRDRIVVPAGWDSWGKITVLREGFDARAWGDAWEADLEDGADTEHGARKMYRSLVLDQGAKPPALPPFNSPMPEQNLLAKHYDENAKKPDRDPRGAFRNPGEMPGAGATAGIVGPLGSSSFSLPNVERALSEMEAGAGLNASVAGGDGARRASARAGAGASGASGGGGAGGGRPPVSPGGTSPGGAGQTQHEVLQNFFQSLLSSKDRAGASAKVNGNGNSSGPEDAS